MDARAANDRIAEQARRLRFVSRVPMLCECSGGDCREIVMISLRDYEQIRREQGRFLTAPDHEVEGAELENETPDYAIRRLRGVQDGSNGDCRSA